MPWATNNTSGGSPPTASGAGGSVFDAAKTAVYRRQVIVITYRKCSIIIVAFQVGSVKPGVPSRMPALSVLGWAHPFIHRLTTIPDIGMQVVCVWPAIAFVVRPRVAFTLALFVAYVLRRS